jgi:hypothetical protein
LISLLKFKSNETAESKLDFADVPLIPTDEGFMASYLTERLPIWDEGDNAEFPPDGLMARKHYMANGGDLNYFYESGAAAETWMTCSENFNSYDYNLIHSMYTLMQKLNKEIFDVFDIVYYFKDEHEFGHVY